MIRLQLLELGRDAEVRVVGDLPPIRMGRRGTDWPAVLKIVDKAKGKWCDVGEFDASVASQIRRGEWRSIDPEVYEVSVRRTGEGSRVTLFMRRSTL